MTNNQTHTQSHKVFNKSAINTDGGRDKLQEAIGGDTVRWQADITSQCNPPPLLPTHLTDFLVLKHSFSSSLSSTGLLPLINWIACALELWRPFVWASIDLLLALNWFALSPVSSFQLYYFSFVLELCSHCAHIVLCICYLLSLTTGMIYTRALGTVLTL